MEIDRNVREQTFSAGNEHVDHSYDDKNELQDAPNSFKPAVIL
jgi:hypothetical protein